MTELLSWTDRQRLTHILRTRLHLETLHPFQADVIARLLKEQSVLAVVATGAGKSLCYQLPSLYWEQGVLVVSPLVALMNHQSEKMAALNIASRALTGQIEEGEQSAILREWMKGTLRLLYVAPERLGDIRFKEALQKRPPKLLVVDEAHCISEWGYDFRPEYRRIRLFREFVGQPPVLALTATATERVKADIRWQLTRDEEPFTLVEGGVDRPNIFFSVEAVAESRQQLQRVARLVGEVDGGVIIYCGSRKNVERWAKYLGGELKEPVRHYHAGMEPAQRRVVEREFSQGRLRVVAATTAFGMGIDRGDIRRVIHVTVPPSLDAYYQEIGRAGRDGQPAEALMVVQSLDLYRRERWIRDDQPDAQWVGEVIDRIAVQPAHRWVTWELDERDARTSVVLAVLEDRGMVATSPAPYGIRVMRETNSVLEQREAVVHRLMQFWRQRQTLFEEMAHYVEGAQCRREMLLRYYGQLAHKATPCCDQCASGPRPSGAWRADTGLVDQLRRWRRQEAERLVVEPYIVLSDRDLLGIALKRPGSLEALAQCRGMGPKRMEKHGPRLVALIQEYERAAGSSLPTVDATSARDRAVWHFQAGTPWQQVVAEVGRSEGTVQGYLTDWIGSAPESEWIHYVRQWISPDEYQRMEKLMEEAGAHRLRPLFEAADGRYTYRQWGVARAIFGQRKGQVSQTVGGAD